MTDTYLSSNDRREIEEAATMLENQGHNGTAEYLREMIARATAVVPSTVATTELPPDRIRFDFINTDGNEDSHVITHDDMRGRYAALHRMLVQSMKASFIEVDDATFVRAAAEAGVFCTPAQAVAFGKSIISRSRSAERADPIQPPKLPDQFKLLTQHEMLEIERGVINSGTYDYLTYGAAIELVTLERADFEAKPGTKFAFLTQFEKFEIKNSLIRGGAYDYVTYGAAIERATLQRAGFYSKPDGEKHD